MSELTPYELGKLRLQAFALLDGWGTQNERGVVIPHHLAKRKEIAAELVEWATSKPDTETPG
jgi:hypothetical protein